MKLCEGLMTERGRSVRFAPQRPFSNVRETNERQSATNIQLILAITQPRSAPTSTSEG